MTFSPTSRRLISPILIVSMFLLSVFSTTSMADIASTHDIITEQSATMDRAQLVDALEREDVRMELEKYGVNPDEAMDRVGAMTNQEVRQLTQNLHAMPAGAGGGIAVVLLLVILILILV